MKVSIIDNSLCDSSFVSDVKPEAIKAYTDALHEFGVSYIEMTTDSFIMIPPASDMSKIILRMTSVRDLLYINSFDFACTPDRPYTENRKAGYIGALSARVGLYEGHGNV